ncbi:lipoprotein [Lysobacter enzymogenes]|uniref:Lipoprotein n=1 Tax=Lysobacter enzymogenes TaxID=69 RepID=A0A0S2DAU7_LYSEN|nr:DUF3574 domain-containing protein [Lysobacter enzymogenes]ALN55642.1 lipoprotein [Lysobacter enzymogenes]
MLRPFSLAIALCALSACASLAPLPVKPGDPSACAERRQDRVLFGMNSPDGPVGEAQWQSFLAEVVTPRFPAGLTVYQAKGQWRGDSGQVEQEDSRAIDVIHADTAEERKRVVEIADEYKRRFKQEAVLIVSSPVRACFAVAAKPSGRVG